MLRIFSTARDRHGAESAAQIHVSVAEVGAGVCALKMSVGFELVAYRNSAQQSVASLSLAYRFDSELEKSQNRARFGRTKKVWRSVWDDFRNWLIRAA
jgi:hypothetical protein